MHFWLDDDTGADHMQIYANDLTLLQNATVADGLPRPELPPLLGLVAITQANGMISTHSLRILEVNLINEHDKPMASFWDWVEAVVLNEHPHPITPRRICGPWLRHRYYTGTSPDGKNRLWIHDGISGFRHVKNVHFGKSGPPPGLDYSAFDQDLRKRIMDGVRPVGDYNNDVKLTERDVMGPPRVNPPGYASNLLGGRGRGRGRGLGGGPIGGPGCGRGAGAWRPPPYTPGPAAGPVAGRGAGRGTGPGAGGPPPPAYTPAPGAPTPPAPKSAPSPATPHPTHLTPPPT